MIVIAQCTGSKLGVECEAQEMYTASTYFCKQRNYAETADAWYIQSAKHGLLEPTEVIKPYNKHANDIDDPTEWAGEINAQLHTHIRPPETVELLGGSAYTKPLVPMLDFFGYEVKTPLDGLGIGERMAKLEEMCE